MGGKGRARKMRELRKNEEEEERMKPGEELRKTFSVDVTQNLTVKIVSF